MAYTSATVSTLNEQLTGPEEWLNERDKELEALCDRLYYAEKDVKELANRVHSRQVRMDGTTVLDHVTTVAYGAEKLASSFFYNLDLPNEIRYNIRICQYAAMLHEVLPFSGLNYEAIAFVADKSVADSVCALTPYYNEPFTVRLDFMANKVNRCGPTAQIVKLVDLLHDGAMYDKLVEDGGVCGLFNAVQNFSMELEMFSKSFQALAKVPEITPYVEKFYTLIERLYIYMKKVDGKEVKKRK